MTTSNGPHPISQKFTPSTPFSRVDLAMMNGNNVIIIEDDKAFTYIDQSGTFTLESDTPKLSSEVNFPTGVEASFHTSREIQQGTVVLLKNFKSYTYSFENQTITGPQFVAIP